MKNLKTQIKLSNKIYKNMKYNFDSLKKLFKNEYIIYQKIVLAEKLTNQVYMSIMTKYQER